MGFRAAASAVAFAAMMAGAAPAAHAQAMEVPLSGLFSVDCENGVSYRLQAGPVTTAGDVITGHFYLAPNRGVHVRLIPMGDGYRYAGRGLWLDGIRDRAYLYFGKERPFACKVAAI